PGAAHRERRPRMKEARMTDLSRCSLNTATVKHASLTEAVEAAAGAGLGAVGLWRHQVQEAGAETARKVVEDAGLRVSSLCRGGFLTAPWPGGVREAMADAERALVEAAAVGTSELVLVVGGLPGSAPEADPAPGTDRILVATRRRVADRLADLAPLAEKHGV